MEACPGGGESSWMSQTGRQGTMAPELPSSGSGVGPEDEKQVCSLLWCPGQVVTRRKSYHGDDHHCCVQKVSIGASPSERSGHLQARLAVCIASP